MKEKDYQAILGSIDASLRIVGEPPDHGVELRLHRELRKLRETIIRARRDALTVKSNRPDSRSPMGVP